MTIYDEATEREWYMESQYDYFWPFDEENLEEEDILWLEETRAKERKLKEEILKYTYFERYSGEFALINYPVGGPEEAANVDVLEEDHKELLEILDYGRSDGVRNGWCKIAGFNAPIEVLEDLLEICKKLAEYPCLDPERAYDYEIESMDYEFDAVFREYLNMPWWDACRAWDLCEWNYTDYWPYIDNTQQVIDTLKAEWENEKENENEMVVNY